MPSAPPAGGALGRRIAVTLVVVLLAFAGKLVLLPDLDPVKLEPFLHIGPGSLESWLDLSNLSIFALGLMPAISAFSVVELIAAATKRGQQLRHGGAAGRAVLLRITMILTLILAGWQAFGIVQWLSGLDLVEPSAGLQLRLGATLVAGVFAHIAGATVISRYGLGNGYVVLLVSGWIGTDLLAIANKVNAMEGWFGGPLAALTPLLFAAAVTALTLSMMGIDWQRYLRGTHHDDDEPEPAEMQQPALKLPTSGITPVAAASSVLMLPATFEAFGVVWRDASGRSLSTLLMLGDWVFNATYLLVLVLLTVGLSYLFNQPRRVAALWGCEPARAYNALRAATLRTLGYLVAMEVIRIVAVTVFPMVIPLMPSLIMLVCGTALALDIAAQWRAHHTGQWVCVRQEHRSYAIALLQDALHAEGIETAVGNHYYRRLAPFFDAFAPIKVMVSPSERERAEAILQQLLEPA